MSTYKCLIKSLKMMERRLPLYMTGIFMMTAFNALFEVSGSFFMKIIFEAAGNGTLSGYSSRIIITIIAGICSIIIASFFMCIYNNEAKRMTLEMKENVFAKAMSLPYEYYEEHQSSEIISKMIYDTDTACNIYSSRLRRVLAPVIFVLVFVIAMVTINPLMTLILLILNILLFMANALLSKDNIRYGKPSASDEKIIEAAKLANAHIFIESLAEGYDTILDSRGNNLSGGQVQRIAMARAIVKNSPIILMDEATSALDNESEQLIAKSIAELKNRKTIIMIAHRSTTIKNADLVIKISNS